MGSISRYTYFGTTPHPVTVTTRIITFLIGNPYKPSFATVTGRGPHPRYTYYISWISDSSMRMEKVNQKANIFSREKWWDLMVIFIAWYFLHTKSHQKTHKSKFFFIDKKVEVIFVSYLENFGKLAHFFGQATGNTWF